MRRLLLPLALLAVVGEGTVVDRQPGFVVGTRYEGSGVDGDLQPGGQ